MKVSSFAWEEDDNRLNQWLEDNLGKEFFNPDEGRLPRYFNDFKQWFIKHEVPIITVAGTNGKGEVCLLLEELLLQEGHSPLLWSSPHVLTVRERFSINGLLVEANSLLQLFQEKKSLTQSLSYYEFLFFIFCSLVKEAIDAGMERPVIIFEVGLGGRLDATNFFDADLSAVTSIGRDHMEFLGPKLTDVLREKIAVARSGRPLVLGLEREHLKSFCHEYCTQKNIPYQNIEYSKESSFRDKNWQLAQRLAELYLGHEIASRQRPKELWARPFKVTYENHQFTLLGSHNLDGLRSMVQWVADLSSEQTGSGPDEVWLGMSRQNENELAQCLTLIDSSPCLGPVLRCFAFDHPRATSLTMFRKVIKSFERGTQKKVYFETDFKNLFIDNEDHKKVLVCGSYYFLGSLLQESSLRSGLYK